MASNLRIRLIPLSPFVHLLDPAYCHEPAQCRMDFSTRNIRQDPNERYNSFDNEHILTSFFSRVVTVKSEPTEPEVFRIMSFGSCFIEHTVGGDFKRARLHDPNRCDPQFYRKPFRGRGRCDDFPSGSEICQRFERHMSIWLICFGHRLPCRSGESRLCEMVRSLRFSGEFRILRGYGYSDCHRFDFICGESQF